jgi:uncharacterized membrane protein
MTAQLYTLFILVAAALAGDRLGRTQAGQVLGGVILTMLIAILLANAGALPSHESAAPVYRMLLEFVAPAAIFLLLLEVNLGDLRRAGRPMLVAFVVGAAGTLVGVLCASWATDAPARLGVHASTVAGMFAATYIGGSPNLNAVALQYGLGEEPGLLAAANAADAAVGIPWLVVLVVLVGLFHRLSGTRPDAAQADHDVVRDARPVTVRATVALLALATGGVWLSNALGDWTSELAFGIPAILILTTLALVVAQVPAVRRLGGAGVLGTAGIYLFVAALGANCDFRALAALGPVAGALLMFAAITVLVHGIVQFGVGRLLGLSPEVLAVASCANVGGVSTILPVARGIGRMDLLLPGMLVAALGTAAGTYLGFGMVWLLRTLTA